MTLSVSEVLVIILVTYAVIGILCTLAHLYTSDFQTTPDELLVVLFLWPLIIWFVLQQNGLKKTIEKGFLRDKKGFFTRYFIMVLGLIIMVALADFISNII